MFRITPKGPNRVDIEFSGKLDRDDMKVALDELLTKTKDIRNGRMLYRVGDFELPTLSAFVVKFWRLPEMFRLEITPSNSLAALALLAAGMLGRVLFRRG